MKKDLEWLKKEIKDKYSYLTSSSWRPERKRMLRIDLDTLFALFNQLDEPVLTDDLLEDAQGVLLQMKVFQHEEDWYKVIKATDEPEVLSQEWVDEHAEHHEYIGYAGVPVDDLQNLLVPKQELPVIPIFVAYVIEAYKSNSSLTNLLADLAFHGGLAEFVEHEDEDEVFEWARSNRKAMDEILARAWLYGYEVEEEQKYIVSDNSSVPLLIKNDSGEIMSYDSQIAYNNSNGTIELTEQEIKDYDERYWPFAVKVEELEE